MVNKQKKLIAFSLLTAVTAFGVTLVALNGVDVGAFSSKAAGVDYELTLNGSNGNVADDAFSLKTKEAQFATAAGNTWKVNYKNAKAANGKVAVIGAKGYYALGEPVYGLGEVVFNSNAQAGDAVVKYGKTSWCLDGEADLATGTINMNGANYFKIVAKNEVTINSVGMNYSCSGETGVLNARMQKVSNGWEAVRIASGYTSTTKIVVPDYYWTQEDKSDYAITYDIANVSNCGLTEEAKNLEEIYIPETVEIMSGTYTFYSANKVKEYTLGRCLRTANGSYYLPKGALEVLNIHSKRLSVSSAKITKSDYPNLKTVNVSYDVESLPNIVSSWADGVTINYEGTEAEWAALTSGVAIWNNGVTVMCSDTTVSKVKLHLANCALTGYADGDEISVVTGKELADPGKPVYEENAKKFDGWYDAAEGGNKVVFPVEVNEDMDLYAQFIDWPAGNSLDNPKDVSACGTFNLYSDADVPYTYIKYTAAKDEVVKFRVDNILPTSCTAYAKFYDGQKQLLTLDFNNTIAYDSSEKVARFFNTAETWKIRFEQGETYYVAIGLGPNGGQVGTFDLIVETVSATAADDYTVAKAYTVGQKETFEMNKYWRKWFKFTVEETGDYWYETGDGSTVWVGAEIGYFNDGTWTKVQNLNSAINSIAAAVVHLEAGKQYYIAANANGTGNGVFKITNSAPAGTAMGNAVTAVVDGDAVALDYVGVNKGYAKFNVTEAGSYILTAPATKGTSSSTITLYNAAEEVNENKVTLSNGVVSTEKVVALEAGTYYAVVSTLTSYSNYEFKVAKAPAGYNANLAINVPMTLETASITLDHKNVNGTYFKFTAPATKYIVFTGTDIAQTITINGDKMKDGEMHAKFTGGNTYNIVVTGDLENGIVLNVEFLDSIKDGKSKETAFDYTLGSRVTPGSTCTYYQFVAPGTGDYIMKLPAYNSTFTSASYVYYFKLYKGETRNYGTLQSNKKDVVFALEEGETYRIEAYGQDFVLSQLLPGTMKTNAIEKTVGAQDASIVLANQFADGTWYKFNAPAKGFLGLVAADGAVATVYLNDKTNAEGISGADPVEFAVAANDVVYVFVTGEVGDHTFTISHPESIQNGLSRQTAFVHTVNEGTDGFKYTWTGGSSTQVWVKVSLVAGQRYYFAISSAGVSDATDGYNASSASTILTDENGTATGENIASAGYGNSAYCKYGADSDDAAYLFTATATGDFFVSYKMYKAGPYEVVAHFGVVTE